MSLAKDILYQKEKERALVAEGVFFTIRYNTPNRNWEHIKDARKTQLNSAEEVAKNVSERYVNSIVTINIGDGDVIIEIWQDGKLLFTDSELHEKFNGKDYSEYWG